MSRANSHKAHSKKRAPTIEMASLRFSSKGATLMAETVFNPKKRKPIHFCVFQGGKIRTRLSFKRIRDGARIVPPRDPNRMLEKGVVLLAARPAPYRSQTHLLKDLIQFIHRYADIPEFWEELIAHYVLMSWCFDRFSAVPYLRFLGEAGTAKTRLLQIAAHTCYKGIMAGGATTASPLFRLIELYGGATVVIDEADYKASEAWSDIIKILNCGYMRGIPVLRSEKTRDTYEPRAFDVFGPKVIANRSRFSDRALESRCITLETAERRLRDDISRQLPLVFLTEAQELRNKLLRWRFESFARIQIDESPLRHLDPRMTQIGTPLYCVSDDQGFRHRLVAFLEKHATEERLERPQALVVEAIRSLIQTNGNILRVKGVANEAKRLIEEGEWEGGSALSEKRTGSLVRSLGFKPGRTREGYKFEVDQTRLAELVERYRPTEP